MRIQEYNYPAEQNSRITRNLQDFSTNTKPAEIVVNPSSQEVSPSDNVKPVSEPEQGADLKISESGTAVLKAVNNGWQQIQNYAPVNFSTKSDADTAGEQTANAGQNGNRVLDQYRFFVQTAGYEGTEGIVRRIFG